METQLIDGRKENMEQTVALFKSAKKHLESTRGKCAERTENVKRGTQEWFLNEQASRKLYHTTLCNLNLSSSITVISDFTGRLRWENYITSEYIELCINNCVWTEKTEVFEMRFM